MTGPGRLGDLLDIQLPIVQGPFGGGLSSVALTAAVSRAGGLGSYGAHVLAPEAVTELVAELRRATDRPFAVNLWVPQPGEDQQPDQQELNRHVARLRPYYDELGIAPPDIADLGAPPRFADQLDALLAAAPPAISLVMGPPPRHAVAEARRRGIVLIGTATTVDEAVALEEAGVDAVVASGSDAGGHRGSFLRPVRESLVGTFALVPQVVDAVSVPVVAAGGVADARGVAAAFALGADAVQVGTGFLATRESGAGVLHKRALADPSARHTVLTRLFSGRPARGIPNGFVTELADHEAAVPPYPVQNALMRPIRTAAVAQGRVERLNLWSGQAATLARHGVTAADYLATLADGLPGRRPAAT
ncbi:nitronate monooxygenase [Streptomyces durbertensis]|uniref:Propionate 3-nitronate monooxygenase n=1 Tax=Streptomyces durbertensis TaxID=2448886 RepID=A0ABR6EMF1_9ACTN|nr:nitronate monooxygenase [Streptomyces durbertensis]MBB1246528.1 nitronate monooxygenase [Streptomyces durbertensis]